jgi:DNA-binding MarR family transcriptional regulator
MIMALAVEYPEDLAARIGFLLARAHLVAREEADRALGELGLTAKGYAALATVVSDAPISQQRLSRRLRMDPATMVDVIDELERSGCILRRRNPDDRREYALVTTRKGRTLFQRARGALNTAERKTLRDLDAQETRTLRDLLGRIARKPSSLITAEMEKNVLGTGP